MTIQQLQYVLEISRTGSVSKAAKTLYLSQPNLSNAIKNLENELGITIFERTPMGMQLTASGMKLAKKATSIMADIQEITSGISAEEDCLFRLVYPPLRACLRGLLGFVHRLPGDGSSSFFLLYR